MTDTHLDGAHPRVAADVSRRDIGRLLIRCADRPGIVAAVSGFLAEHGANIISLDQHSTAISGGTFFQRMEFHLPGLPARRDSLEAEFLERVAQPMGMDVRLTDAARPQARRDHGVQAGPLPARPAPAQPAWELHMTIPMVISNHPDLADPVRRSPCRSSTSR